MPTVQGRYWMLTIPVQHHPNQPQIRDNLVYLKGQQERAESGLLHWQLLAAFNKKVSLAQVKTYFCPQAHVELTRSEAADSYVHKDDTALVETRFEIGKKSLKRNSKEDWDKVYQDAKQGNIDNIPPDILIRNYNSIKRIRVDNMQPVWRHDINVKVYWGGSGLGKTRRAWFEAGDNVYVKDPNTKWWDGYRGEAKVIIDEFIGTISIAHILRWLDRYPCFAEIKGFTVPLTATEFWITSNIDPREWYPDAKPEQVTALLRRCNVVRFLGEWLPPPPSPTLSIDLADELNSIFEL